MTGNPHSRTNIDYRPQVAIFDTAAASRNLGDEVIMDAVRRQLRATAPEAFFVSVPTHDAIGPQGQKLIQESHATVVGGTNLLSSEMNKYAQWHIRPRDFRWLTNVILLGVGWWQYQTAPNLYTRLVLRRVLHRRRLHSLRDGYTVDQLGQAGFANLLNTSCVTLWELNENRQSAIPHSRSGSVVATLTDYKPDPSADRGMLEILQEKYDRVFVWIQGAGDFEYLKSLGVAGVETVDPQLAAYDDLLASSQAVDYVGTRLHAGVRAMTHGRRTIIISVDNRATEISRDTGLTVLSREGGIEALSDKIEEEFPTRLRLPWDAIEAWRQSLREELGLPSLSQPVS